MPRYGTARCLWGATILLVLTGIPTTTDAQEREVGVTCRCPGRGMTNHPPGTDCARDVCRIASPPTTSSPPSAPPAAGVRRGNDDAERERAAREAREEERRRREEEERQREFERDRAALLGDLRGTTARPSSSGGTAVDVGAGQVGDRVEALGLKAMSAVPSIARDTAWQQLYCAAGIAARAGEAMLAFELHGEQTALHEAQFLVTEAQAVLGGGAAAVECQRAWIPHARL